MTYRPQTIQESHVLLQAGLDEEYDAFFKAKLKKYGVDDPGDMSDEEKKKFFNEVELEWEEGKGPTDKAKAEAAVRAASPDLLDALPQVAVEPPAQVAAPVPVAPEPVAIAPEPVALAPEPVIAPVASEVAQADAEDTGEEEGEEEDADEASEDKYSTDDLEMDQRMYAVAEVGASMKLSARTRLALEEAADAVGKLKAKKEALPRPFDSSPGSAGAVNAAGGPSRKKAATMSSDVRKAQDFVDKALTLLKKHKGALPQVRDNHTGLSTMRQEMASTWKMLDSIAEGR